MPVREDLNLHALRDAIGLARTMYAAESVDGADPERLLSIRAAGALLVDALKLAQLEPRSLGWRAAPTNARKGFDELAKATSGEVRHLVQMARQRALPLG